MSLRIVHYNDPILRKKGVRLSAFDADLAMLAREMIATMHAAAGIGLAAQQIGRALQLCVIDLRDAEPDLPGSSTASNCPSTSSTPIMARSGPPSAKSRRLAAK